MYYDILEDEIYLRDLFTFMVDSKLSATLLLGQDL